MVKSVETMLNHNKTKQKKSTEQEQASMAENVCVEHDSKLN